MNLGEAKRRVLMLLDEYSSGGEIIEDRDISNKMAEFFDMAQKEIAGHKRIIRKVEITLSQKTEDFAYYDLPSDFWEPFRIWKGTRLQESYPIIAGKLAVPGDKNGTIVLEYFAYPSTITSATPDSYEFEVCEDAANCLPFFVAAQQLISDLVVAFEAFWNIYLQRRAALGVSPPSSGGKTFISQKLYRR